MGKKQAKFMISGRIIEIGEEQTFNSGFTKREVIIETSINEEKFSNPIKLTFKKDACAKVDNLNVGDECDFEGFVEGRKWDGPKGTSYFIDLAAKSVMVTGKAEKAEPKLEEVTDWDLLLKFGAAYGETKDGVTERCKAYAEKNGKRFKTMNEADWKKLAEEIAAAHSSNEETSADDDDMPF